MRRRSENVLFPVGASEDRVPWPPSFTAEDVIQALGPLVTPTRYARLEAVIASRLGSVTVVMDAPHDPHNGGAVLRSADAFGLARMHVVARNEPFALSTTVTRSSEKWVDLVVHERAADATSALVQAGFELVATHPEGELYPEDLRHIPRLALVLGNERDGICEELDRAAKRSVRVPMRGFVESLNVSVSGAILLHAGVGSRPGDLSEQEKRVLLARGLFGSVNHPNQVLLGCAARAAAAPAE